MKGKLLFAVLILSVITSLMPVVEAHERQVFQVADRYYLFTVGSLNEPVSTGDKTGVDLRVQLLNGSNASAPGARPVEGLEGQLQVELIASGQTKILALSPRWQQPGAYDAYFYPSEATSYSYRIFGTLNSVPFDVTFSCADAGHMMHGVENYETKAISESVTSIFQAGGFGCPKPHEASVFPTQQQSFSQHIIAWIALVVAFIALIVACVKRR